MLDTSRLNPVARIIINCFQDAGFDEPYIHSKVERLESFGDDKWGTLHWASSQLDSKNQARFAEKVGVSVGELRTAFEVIRTTNEHMGV